MCSLPLPVKAGSTHPVDVGEAAEAVAIAELVRRGHVVLVPHGSNHKYDLAIDAGDRLVRVQVKTGRLDGNVMRFGAGMTRTNMREVRTRTYGPNEIDAFLVVCPALNQSFWIPIADATPGNGVLRLAPAANNQRARVKWAADYALPAVA